MKSESYLVPVSIVVAGVIIAVAIFTISQKSGPVSLTPSSSPEQANLSPGADQFKKVTEKIDVSQDPVLGTPEAKLLMIEFSDFQCPFCQRHALNAFPEIKKQYIDTGKVKLVFKNLPLPADSPPYHKNAQLAAEAGECAFEQNKFWEYKDKLFQDQQKLGKDDLKLSAKELGLDSQKFDDCLDSRKYEQEVKEDLAEAQKLGIGGTPSFVIGDILVDGAYPFSTFEKIIEEKLKQ